MFCFTSLQFTNVQYQNVMYKYISYDGHCIVMDILIIEAEYSLQKKKLFLCLAVLVVWLCSAN